MDNKYCNTMTEKVLGKWLKYLLFSIIQFPELFFLCWTSHSNYMVWWLSTIVWQYFAKVEMRRSQYFQHRLKLLIITAIFFCKWQRSLSIHNWWAFELLKIFFQICNYNILNDIAKLCLNERPVTGNGFIPT